ncbi:MAG: type IV secretory system conjugative DNA transfer family protein [Paracoccaceae bacterium]
MDQHNETFRFGSARAANERELKKAGLYRQADDSLFFGFMGKKPMFYSGMGGAVLIAGARSGKLTTCLAFNACYGIAKHTLVFLDIKGEIAAISQYQVPDRKYCIYWNPLGLHFLPQHRINPVDYIRKDSLSLVSDVKVLCENLVVSSGSAQGIYFEGRAREFLEGIILTLTETKGVLTLPDLYHVISLIPAGGDEWLDFGFEMSQCGFPISRRIEEEIAKSRETSSNGFDGILGEIYRAVAPLSDPVLMASVSPPFDFSMRQLCESDQRYQLYLMPAAEMVSAWSGIIKAIFVAGMIYKARAPQAPKQTWILDECGQLGGFPMIPKLFTYGAGIGIQPFAVFQNTTQMDQLAPKAGDLISSSAALALYFATRDLPSATQLSRMLGVQTLEYDDPRQQAAAQHAKSQAAQAILSGNDPLRSALEYRHQNEAASRKTKQNRLLRTPDEIIMTPPDKGYAFVDGLAHPVFFDRRPYYEKKWMNGRWFPNPYHPPVDRVRVKTFWGYRTHMVRDVPAPANLAHYPQYACGRMRKIDL